MRLLTSNLPFYSVTVYQFPGLWRKVLELRELLIYRWGSFISSATLYRSKKTQEGADRVTLKRRTGNAYHWAVTALIVWRSPPLVTTIIKLEITPIYRGKAQNPRPGILALRE